MPPIRTSPSGTSWKARKSNPLHTSYPPALWAAHCFAFICHSSVTHLSLICHSSQKKQKNEEEKVSPTPLLKEEDKRRRKESTHNSSYVRIMRRAQNPNSASSDFFIIFALRFTQHLTSFPELSTNLHDGKSLPPWQIKKIPTITC